jgi:ATP-binding cassette subfamily F protein uup
MWLKENEKKENKWAVLESNKSRGQTTEEAVVSNVATIIEAPKKKASFKEKREFEILEKEMPALEAEKLAITEKMSTGNLGFEELQKLSDRMIAITQLLEEKELRWLELSEMV